jgi:hypothetical protein
MSLTCPVEIDNFAVDDAKPSSLGPIEREE